MEPGQVVEVKSVKNLYNTRQLRGEAQYAAGEDATFTVAVSPGTKISGRALDTIFEVNGEVVVDWGGGFYQWEWGGGMGEPIDWYGALDEFVPESDGWSDRPGFP